MICLSAVLVKLLTNDIVLFVGSRSFLPLCNKCLGILELEEGFPIPVNCLILFMKTKQYIQNHIAFISFFLPSHGWL